VVEQFGLREWVLAQHSDDPADSELVYIVPRLHEVVVGGTARADDWHLSPSPDVAARILADAERLVPGLSEARVVRHKVGLRPARSRVRLEAEPLPDGRHVVHCYGHGGAGVTLSWGCAAEVADLVGAL